MNTKLVKAVARGLRYRSLNHLIGLTIEFADLERIEETVQLALGPDWPDGCRLAGPEPHFLTGAVAKYGILDLRFLVAHDMLTDDVLTGVPLLRELGYLPTAQVEPLDDFKDDPFCLEMLKEDLDKRQTWLLLFLQGGSPGEAARITGRDGHVCFQLPAGYFPRRFKIADACVTNASGVWLWKHFYF